MGLQFVIQVDGIQMPTTLLNLRRMLSAGYDFFKAHVTKDFQCERANNLPRVQKPYWNKPKKKL